MPVNNPISVQNRQNYGGVNGADKYSPFARITLVNSAANIADYSFLIQSRVNLLVNFGVFPSQLWLTSLNWNAIIQDENTGAAGGPKNPPLVVVSSNRSRYIRTGIATAAAEAIALGVANFNNVNDLRALGTNPNTPSPPIYCPQRLAANDRRSVYVVVQFNEYHDYKAALNGTGIHVIGWNFRRSVNAPGILTGFGATRYAAIEFCKQLRDRAMTQAGGNAPWDVAWLFDDNVVALSSTGSLNAVEARLLAASNAVCAGFHGIAQPQNRAATLAWANSVWPARRQGNGIPDLPPTNNSGLVQQAACWNIAQMQALNLNFSPIFVTSKEDVSLSTYFQVTPFPYLYYSNNDVRKESVTILDNVAGAGGVPALTGSNAVNTGKAAYAGQFALRENATPIQPLPLPAAPTTLGQYIINPVLANAAAFPAAQTALVTTQQQAACQAIEQVMTAAIKGTFPGLGTAPPAGSVSFAPANTLDATFRPAIAAAAALTVTRRDVP